MRTSKAEAPRPLGDLLRSIRQSKGAPLPAMAAQLDITRNTLGDYEREKTLPSPEFLVKFSQVTGWDVAKLIQARFDASQFSPGLNAALKQIRDATAVVSKVIRRHSSLTDEQISKLQEAAVGRDVDSATLEREFGLDQQSKVEQPRASYVYLPLYDVRGTAGEGGEIVGSEHVIDMLAFTDDFIRRELRQDPSDLMLAFVEGDSGEPDLRSGDICLINRRDQGARREGIYYVRMDGAILVKQIQRLPGGVMKLSSRNPNYEPFTVPLSQLESDPNGFAVIGRIVWACRRF